MATTTPQPVLIEALGVRRDTLRNAALVLGAIAALTLAAKIRVPMWPVPMTLQTLVVLTVGVAYGPRLALASTLGYLALGALGVAVFAGDSAGLAYMAGPTAGYLAGFAVAAWVMGMMARRGLDRTRMGMVASMLAGTALIYAFGLGWMAWLFGADKGMGWVLQYGMLNFLAGDLVKLAIAAMIVPAIWKRLR